MVQTLKGTYDINNINLLGKNNSHIQPISTQIKKIKDRIINDYLIPLYSNQWSNLKENIFFLDNIYNKLTQYYKTYKLDELILYIDLLKVIHLLIDKHKLLENTEEKIYGKENKNEIMSMVFKTISIKLLPEYEIYNSIIGKPKKDLDEKYNDKIIYDIKMLLLQKDINYSKIKKYILDNYKL